MKAKKTLQSGLHFLIWREGKYFVARCLEVEVTSQGKSKIEATKNLEEALSLYSQRHVYLHSESGEFNPGRI
jgi:predicted RNase H-like HicB family nuclease